MSNENKVVLPEPDFLQRHEDVCGDEVGPPTAFYTADTVRALLAGVSAPAAQAAPAAQSVANADGRFTKNPVTIDAIKWTGSNLREVIAFTDGPPDTRSIHAGMAWEAYVDLVARDGLKIYTLEGKMLANIGDWIIRGIKGEYYPCKPDIFEATYTSAPQAQAVPDGWREQFETKVYADLAAADNQDVPLEEYPARILKVLDSIVGPRHPAVVQWRNDAIKTCIAIAYKYCRDPDSHKYLKQDLEALLTAEPAPAAAKEGAQQG